jgi:hypothetical protein
MRGKTAKLLRKATFLFNDAGHPVSYKKLKALWLRTPRCDRRGALEATMKQAQVYFVSAVSE